MAFLSCDPNFGRTSSRFDLILSSGIVPAGNKKIIPRAHDSEITCVQFNQDGTKIATGCNDGIIKIWDSKTMQEIPMFMHRDRLLDSEYNNDSENSKVTEENEQFSTPITCLAFSYCNDFIAACSCDYQIKIWNIGSRRAKLDKCYAAHKDIINSCKFMIGSSFIEPMLVTGSSDRTIKFWKEGKPTSLSCTSECLCLDALILDCIVASGHSDGSVRVWSSKQFSLLCRFGNLHTEGVTSLCINPITYTITSVSKDHSIKLIDYKQNHILDEKWPDDYINIKQSSESISSGSYSQHIVVASKNGKILIYNLENSKNQKKIRIESVRKSKSIYTIKFFTRLSHEIMKILNLN